MKERKKQAKPQEKKMVSVPSGGSPVLFRSTFVVCSLPGACESAADYLVCKLLVAQLQHVLADQK